MKHSEFIDLIGMLAIVITYLVVRLIIIEPSWRELSFMEGLVLIGVVALSVHFIKERVKRKLIPDYE
ncbi:hypothetical protein [Sphingomicrobium flavum]|uniref:hypothetical protein n=1 Tax=Sphingomicrobium flavum TaxID=1229164 RepID=UPI0021AE022C|nr:hypothetical protein [Sphingomicrobium flavum]